MLGHSETDLTESDSAESSNLNFTFHLQVVAKRWELVTVLRGSDVEQPGILQDL
ncbi:hypothetical protein fugu_012029 [Takifugu bimaculatus]|uniref:Uncharacterized protein n=1 Tax=Takifugu bimaculatus TaxID=433685 RepID=A0A4Z2C993_9TELE|nr:hypothetical protein fugu_012029 [Takifugu bimaculatus]